MSRGARGGGCSPPGSGKMIFFGQNWFSPPLKNRPVRLWSSLFSLGPKCTLTASHAAPGESRWIYADGTDRQTDGRQTVTLRFPLDAASVKSKLTYPLSTPIYRRRRQRSFLVDLVQRCSTCDRRFVYSFRHRALRSSINTWNINSVISSVSRNVLHKFPIRYF